MDSRTLSGQRLNGVPETFRRADITKGDREKRCCYAPLYGEGLYIGFIHERGEHRSLSLFHPLARSNLPTAMQCNERAVEGERFLVLLRYRGHRSRAEGGQSDHLCLCGLGGFSPFLL